MRPERAALDRMLDSTGETVVITHRSDGGTISVVCQAVVRGDRIAELRGGITQKQRKIILSPTPFLQGGWPGEWPAKGDQLIVQGRKHVVEAATPILLNDEVVRIELWVIG